MSADDPAKTDAPPSTLPAGEADAPGPVTADFARRELRDNVVWFRPPEADLGEHCVICSAPAVTGVALNPTGATGGELEMPLCRACERPIGRPRRWASVFVLLGLFLVAPLTFTFLLWALGVDLEAHATALKIPIIGLFIAPFAIAAWLASHGRKLPGVQPAGYRPDTGDLALRFDSTETARRVFKLNWPESR